MKGIGTLLTFQALLSTISGILIAEMSWVGRMSIWLFYSNYGLLRTWWKTALLLFGLQCLLIFLLWLTRQLLPSKGVRIVPVLLLILGGIGAYMTLMDFTQSAHRLLKSNFHLGGYLVWVGWFISCFYFLFYKRKPGSERSTYIELPSQNPDSTDELKTE